MKILSPSVDLDEFFDKVAGARQRVLLLDYDGTLAPFQIERDQAFPYPGVREVLTGILEDGNTRLVVISGRAINDLIPLLGLDPPPEIWGAHGAERLKADGTYIEPDLDAPTRQGLAGAKQVVVSSGWQEHCEQKPTSVAVHWRGLSPDLADSMASQVREQWKPLAEKAGLELHNFDGGLELRVPGKDKGLAVQTIFSETEGETAVAYLGDDLTDEDAFKVIKPKGLAVLVRQAFRPTAADVWLEPPEELLAFLAKWQKIGKGS